jgi:hypothetical protein
MIGTIGPMVNGERGVGRRAAAHWFHLGGAVLGGASAGAVIGWVGSALISPEVAARLTLGFAGLYAFHELGIIRMPTPERHRQVPVAWRTTLPVRVTAAVYGLMLGAGFLTHITTTTTYVMWIAAVASGEPLWSVVVGATYGAARGLPPFILASLSKRRPASVAIYDRVIRGDGRRVHLSNGLLLAVVVGLVGVGLIN